MVKIQMVMVQHHFPGTTAARSRGSGNGYRCAASRSGAITAARSYVRTSRQTGRVSAIEADARGACLLFGGFDGELNQLLQKRLQLRAVLLTEGFGKASFVSAAELGRLAQ
jgi:hypothetical protein